MAETRRSQQNNLIGWTLRYYVSFMTVAEQPKPVERAPKFWPLSIRAYHALGEMGLIPESVIRGSINDYKTKHPRTAELVIEVSVSSHDYDRSKLRAYARAGVQEVWLVLAPEKQMEVHRQPAGEQFRQCSVHGPGGRLTSAAVPSLDIELEALFAS
jgi:hypothetical protein